MGAGNEEDMRTRRDEGLVVEHRNMRRCSEYYVVSVRGELSQLAEDARGKSHRDMSHRMEKGGEQAAANERGPAGPCEAKLRGSNIHVTQ